jgi:hypothetical protein
MLIPGFLAGDLSLGPLADRLRELGCRVFFSLVECGILLGSPVKDPLESSNTFLGPLFELAHRRCADEFAKSTGMRNLDLTPGPLNVPQTDGIVQWQNCIESEPKIEAIEVSSSHLGLPYSSEVFAIIATRLARGSEQQPLRPVSSDVGRMSLRTNRRRHEASKVGSNHAAASLRQPWRWSCSDASLTARTAVRSTYLQNRRTGS